MKFETATVDRQASWIHFVYPFLFEAAEFEARVKAIKCAQWQEGKESITIWEQQQFPEDDLLAHVANYLNPSDKTLATARLWKLNNDLENVYGLDRRAKWQLFWPSQGTVDFRLGKVGKGVFAVQLALFHAGVGFITVCVQPQGERVNDWLDFLHYFRFIRGQREVGVQAQRRTGFDPQQGQSIFSPFFPEPVGGIAKHPEGRGKLDEVLTALLNTGAIAKNADPWWREVFVHGQMLPFAALFVDELPQDEIPHLLYKTHNFFHAQQGDNPAPEDLQADNPAWLPYAERQWFVISLEGCVFVAADAPKTNFFRQTLPNHLRNQYFLLFQIALHQRFALMMLSARVAQNWLIDEDIDKTSKLKKEWQKVSLTSIRNWLFKTNIDKNRNREKVFEDIRNQLLSFTARGYFAQVMQREHHHRCYLKLQEAFQIERLYQEVNDEVREMHEYALMQQTRRVEELINVLGFLILIPGFFLSFLGINLRGITAGDDGIVWWIAVLIVGGGLILGLLVLRSLRN